MISGIGAATGQSSNYILGRGGRKFVKNVKWKKEFDKIEKLFDRYGGFWIIILFSATPLPDDPVHIKAGILKYPAKKYFIASLIGKIILHLIIAYAGFYGIGWVTSYFS